MPARFENGRKFDGNKLVAISPRIWCQKIYIHLKNRSASFWKRWKMFRFRVLTRCRFQNVPVRVPFSKSTVFKICRQKMCRFRVNGRPIRHIFHRFQIVPVSCERSLSLCLESVWSWVLVWEKIKTSDWKHWTNTRNHVVSLVLISVSWAYLQPLWIFNLCRPIVLCKLWLTWRYPLSH